VIFHKQKEESSWRNFETYDDYLDRALECEEEAIN
jgi:hypothetical protein